MRSKLKMGRGEKEEKLKPFKELKNKRAEERQNAVSSEETTEAGSSSRHQLPAADSVSDAVFEAQITGRASKTQGFESSEAASHHGGQSNRG